MYVFAVFLFDIDWIGRIIDQDYIVAVLADVQ